MMASAAWRRWLRGAGLWAVLIAVAAAAAGLGIVWPILLALHAPKTTAVQYAVAPVFICSLALGAAGRWWVSVPLRRQPPAAEYEVGAEQRRLRRYEERASKLRVAAALLAYYVPALLVTIRHSGAAGLDGYFRGHLLDGFGFVGFLTVGWQLITRDVRLATQRLTQSSVVIAIAGAYVAGGTPLEVGLAAVFGEAFFERLWELIISIGLDTGAQDAGRRRRLKKRWFGMAAPAGNELAAGQRLPQQHCLQSGNRRYLLIMWRGQLAVWGPDDSAPVWSSGTDGSDAKYAELDASGRLGLYSADGALAAWQSPVPGGGATVVRLEDDGALAAYRADGTKVWATLPRQVPADRLIFNFGISADLAGEG